MMLITPVSMSRKKNSKVSKKQQPLSKTSIIEQRYSGPIPPAAEFERYNMTLPGAADRILSMSEKQQDHDHKMVRREQGYYHSSKFTAQLIVLIIALSAIAAGTYLILEGHSAIGISAIIGTLATFGTALIFGKDRNN